MAKRRPAPSVHRLEDLVGPQENATLKQINERWVPARPEGYCSLRSRLRHAWMVFTGKGDVLIWPEGQ